MKTKHRKLSTQIWTIAAMSWMVGGGATAFLFYRLEHIVAAYNQRFTRETQQQDLSRQMQVAFKKQVQEWKDILIRRNDPDALKKYTEGFRDEEVVVHHLAQRLENEVDDPGAKATLADFIGAHAALGKAYSAALEKFASSQRREPAGDRPYGEGPGSRADGPG